MGMFCITLTLVRDRGRFTFSERQRVFHIFWHWEHKVGYFHGSGKLMDVTCLISHLATQKLNLGYLQGDSLGDCDHDHLFKKKPTK